MSYLWIYALRILLAIALFGTITAAVFLVLALIGGLRFRSRRVPRIHFTPPVSLLKPVHGDEEELHRNLRSFFDLDYPEFEIIFCARSLLDPAILAAQEVAKEFPSVPVRFIASGEPPWANPKTFSMALLTEQANHEVILYSDSDVRVSRDYLQRVVQPLSDPTVGLITCTFRGKAGKGLASLLVALNQTVEFASGVLSANLLEGMKFGLGPTLLTRKSVIAHIGGFGTMGDLLADDFWLGNNIYRSGYTVVLSPVIVDHFIHYQSLGAGVRHQIGWMKNTRRSRPAGHFGTGLTFAMPFGLLGLVAALGLGHPLLGVLIFLIAYINRCLQALLIGFVVMRDPAALRFFWLYAVCDLMGFFCWVASYFGAVIDYRGERYRIHAGGRIVREPGS